ncbi:MAG: DUF4194 domain-containing protein [Acidimicrobiales bacterium]|nr:DUF4194 domain-containing protein [Acidimicrobiales bacterium]
MNESVPNGHEDSLDLSTVVINLLKGPIYSDSHEKIWGELLNIRGQVADYLAVLGLQVMLDESEGYAFLKSISRDDGVDFPRLIARRSLPFPVSLLLALLRKRLAEFDSSSSETRLVLSRTEIIEMIRIYLPGSTNEVRLVDNIESLLNRLVDMGFVKKLKNDENVYEIRRILKAYVDGEWLGGFEQKLSLYISDFTTSSGEA